MEFNPEYKITHELLNNVRDTHKIIVKLNTKKVPSKIYSKILLESNVENVFNTLSLRSNKISLSEVKEALTTKKTDENSQEAQNYHKALTSLQKIKKKNFDVELVRTLHKQIMKDLVPSKDSGSFRNYNSVFKNDKSGKIIYSPPNHKDVRELTKSLMKFGNKNRGNIDPLILSGLLHKQFLIITPFTDGNRKVGQLLTRILLSDLDFNFFNLLNFEKQYKEDSSKYLEKVGVLGNYYAIKNKIDYTDWLEYFTRVILDEITILSNKLEKQKIRIKLNKDQEKIIKYIQKNGSINDSEYSRLTNRKKSTRVLDFNDMIKKGLLERRGRARQTYYVSKN
jgi:Fic family protein